MVVLGTVVPFWMEVVALTNIRASQVSVVAMIEPLVAIAVAWLALGEVLSGIQLVGAVVVLAGVIITERSR
jgi:drug/metabolite transporter (DMT)-like permease